jgi:hypothetical protein
MTEHAAVIFVFFFLAEYASIVLICILTSILFLGGYLIDITPLLYLYSSISNIFEISILFIIYLSLTILSGLEFLTFSDTILITNYTKDDVLLTIYSIITNFNVINNTSVYLEIVNYNTISNNFISGLLSSIVLGIKASAMIFVFI